MNIVMGVLGLGGVPLDALERLGGLAARLGEVLAGLAAGLGWRHAVWAAAVWAAAEAGWAVLGRRRAARLCGDGRQITVLAPPKVEVDGAAALWTNLHDLLRPVWRRAVGDQPHLGFEYAWTPAGLRISLWTPRSVPPGLVEAAVEAAWPAARTSTVLPAPPPLRAGVACAGGRLRLAAAEHHPLRVEHPADPLRQLIGAAGIPGEGEAAVVQILARPVTGRRLAGSLSAARALRAGRPSTLWAGLLDAATPGGPPPAAAAGSDPTVAGDVRGILDKAAHPGWEVEIRYAVASTAAGADAQRRLRGRAHALACAYALYGGRNRLARRRLRDPVSALAARRLRRGDLLSVPELAALAHLPTDAVVAGLARAGASPVPAPLNVRRDGKVLGDTEVGVRRQVALDVAGARCHMHVIGGTGSGKSTLLAGMVLDDVAAGRGVVLIDPKGDLVGGLLDRIPAAARDRVVLLDPDETRATPTLNLLEGGGREVVADHIVGVFQHVFAQYWGPRTDDVLRSACLTLLHGPGGSLADIPRLLTDRAWRTPRLRRLDDPILTGFWDAYEGLSDAERAQVIGPVMNKLRAFLLRRFVRDLIGHPRSSFDLRQVLDRGGVCLARVPKGVLGEETARLLGSLIVAKVWQAAAVRAAVREDARPDAALYIDECHNFLSLPHSIEDILAEARGYRLSLVLAHQDLAQLPRQLAHAVSANARNKLYFAVSPQDARVLEGHTAPELTAHDLTHLDAYQAAAQLVVDGGTTPAFTLRTRPLPPPLPGNARRVRAAAARNFGLDDTQRRAETLARHQVADEPPPRTRARSRPPAAPGAGSPAGPPAGLRPGGPQHRETAAQTPQDPTAGRRDSNTNR